MKQFHNFATSQQTTKCKLHSTPQNKSAIQ